jgi:hypothetical protein
MEYETINMGIVLEEDSPETSQIEEKKTLIEPIIIKDIPIRVATDDWSGANLETISQWVQISAFQIEALELAIIYYRMIIRQNVLLGVVFSTASGSLSLSQMNSTEQKFVYNIIFTIMSFSIAVFTGLIKIYQIQEQLEEFIQLKQEWIGFSLTITTEVQLPVTQRKRALDLITKNKNKYLDLLKRDADIPFRIKTKAYKHLYEDKEMYLNNIKRYKRLKEISSCTDETYFLKEYKMFEKEESNLYYKEESPFCCNPQKNPKDKTAEKNARLSNILLSVIIEEEDAQRNKQMMELINMIRERKRFIDDKLHEYDIYPV